MAMKPPCRWIVSAYEFERLTGKADGEVDLYFVVPSTVNTSQYFSVPSAFKTTLGSGEIVFLRDEILSTQLRGVRTLHPVLVRSCKEYSQGQIPGHYHATATPCWYLQTVCTFSRP